MYYQDIRIEFGIGKCTMLMMKSANRKSKEGIKLLIQERVRTYGGKILSVSGRIESRYHQTNRDEKKKKRVTSKNKKPCFALEISSME